MNKILTAFIKYLFGILFCLSGLGVVAQTITTWPVKNVLYAEAFGTGGYISANYERLFFSKDLFRVNARLGLGTCYIYDYMDNFNPDIFVPIAVNGFYGRNHNIEIGIGQTISNTVYAKRPSFDPARTTRSSTTFNIGYRYQKQDEGLVIRVGYTPVIEYNKEYKHWFGVSLGLAF